MKNEEIIAHAAVIAGLLTEDEAKHCVEAGTDIGLHTIQGWKNRGNFAVKIDEEPIVVKLWKKRSDGSFYLAKANLYSRDQMELKK